MILLLLFNDHISGIPIHDYLEGKLDASSANEKYNESGKHAKSESEKN